MSYNIVHLNEQDEIELIGNIAYNNYNIVEIYNHMMLFLTHDQMNNYRDIIQLLNEDKLKAVSKQDIAINQLRRQEFNKKMKQLSNIQYHLHNTRASREAEQTRYDDYEQANEL